MMGATYTWNDTKTREVKAKKRDLIRPNHVELNGNVEQFQFGKELEVNGIQCER